MEATPQTCPTEGELVELAHRLVPEPRRQVLQSHVAGCSSCRTSLAALVELGSELGTTDASRERPELPAPLPRGASLGRYLLLDLLGSGGMGLVYAAFDPKLDRRVALKLLRGEQRPDSRERLLREAQALGRLSHRNVVAVHDVGTEDDCVFIAMELVEGQTVGRWLRERPRSWPEVLEVFLQAGEGLWAAHRAGLVHRDFKPDNVLLASNAEGRVEAVRVTDFGLARANLRSDAASSDAVRSDAVRSDAVRSDSGTSARALTQAGTLLGTPAYMSPEQLAGAEADARSDQFSFCVALYEALYGERPFVGQSLGELADSTGAGRVRPPKAGAHVPGWLRDRVLRGLAPSPDDRYPSMAALLATLRKNPARTRRRVLWAALASTVVFAVGVGAQRLWSTDLQRCQGFETRLSSVWDEPRRQAVRAAFLGTNKAFAQGAWDATRAALDAYAAAWVTQRTQACEATHVRREQPEPALQLRIECLERRLMRLDALATLLVSAEAELVEQAPEAAQALPPVSACANASALAAVPPPRDEATARRVEALRKKLDPAQALLDAARFAEGLELARPLYDEARSLGYPPLEAEVALVLGQLQAGARGSEDAERSLLFAAWAGTASRQDELVAQAWIAKLRNEHRRIDVKAAIESLEHARAAVQRLQQPEELQLSLLVEEASLLLVRGKHASATKLLEGAVDRAARLAPRGNLHANMLSAAASANHLAGRYADAVTSFQESIALNRERLGREHPRVAALECALARSEARLGKVSDAIARCEAALKELERLQGPEHGDLTGPLTTLGNLAFERRDFEAARAYQSRALAVAEKVRGKDHVDNAANIANLALIDNRQRKFSQALAGFERAISYYERGLGPEHPKVGTLRVSLGVSYYDQGDLTRSEAELNRALELFTKAYGPTHPEVAAALANRANVRLRRDDFAGTHADLEEAIRILEELVGPDAPALATLLANLGTCKKNEGLLDAALADFTRALSIATKTYGAQSPRVAGPECGRGEVNLLLGRLEDAVPSLERCAEVRGAEADPGVAANSKFNLAQALWLSGKDQARAVTLVREAREGFKKKPGSEDYLRDVARWLAGQRGPPPPPKAP